MNNKLLTLTAALTIAAGAAQFTPAASANAGGNLPAEKLQQLRERASAGDVHAVLEAAREVAKAGADPNLSPDVTEITGLYEKSPGPAHAKALERRALAGDPSAVLEVTKQLVLAGEDPETSEFLAKLTKIYETGPGKAAWEQAIVERAGKGDVRAVIAASRPAALATGDPDDSPFVQKVTQAYQQSKHDTSHETQSPGPETSEPKEPGTDPNDPDTGPATEQKPPAEQNAKSVVRTSETASQLDEDEHYTVTKTTYYDDGSTETTVTEKDKDGNVISQETTTTPATDSLTTGDEGGSWAPIGTLEWTWVDAPTRIEMLGHPTNDPDAGPFTGFDIDYDGRADFVVGHLGGVTDPSPEGGVLGIAQSPEEYLNNLAGPETGPPDAYDSLGLGPVSSDHGSGPIASPVP